MRTLFHGLTALAFGLATCLTASAQTGKQDQDQGQTPGQSQTRSQDQNTTNRNDNNQNNQGERKVIHGIVAGVTVEGELAIDYRTNRAATAEMTYLTIVGSERDRGRNRDQDDRDQARNRDQNDRNNRDQASNKDESNRDQASNKNQNDRDQASNKDQNDRERNNQNDNERRASSENQRHNVYLVRLTPRTEVRRASDRSNNRDRNERNANRGDRNEQNANRGDQNRDETNKNQANQNNNAEQSERALTIEALELGDRVEVRFVQRSTAGDNSNQNMASRKHGRHRTYYGEAVAITILSEPGQNDRDRDSGRGQDRGREPGNREIDRESNNNDKK